MENNAILSNRDLIKAVFDDDIMKYNDWFFKANWKKAEIENLETKNDWLKVKYIIWYNGIWKDGIWKDGTWEDGYWEKGTWKSGEWIKGEIWDSKTKKYRESTVPPNKCKWSLSYGK